MAKIREDRRVRRTRRLLKQGLAELLREKEFKDISIKDITDRMDLNRGPFICTFPIPISCWSAWKTILWRIFRL